MYWYTLKYILVKDWLFSLNISLFYFHFLLNNSKILQGILQHIVPLLWQLESIHAVVIPIESTLKRSTKLCCCLSPNPPFPWPTALLTSSTRVIHQATRSALRLRWRWSAASCSCKQQILFDCLQWMAADIELNTITSTRTRFRSQLCWIPQKSMQMKGFFMFIFHAQCVYFRFTRDRYRFLPLLDFCFS